MATQQARGGLETIDIKGKPYVTVAERIKAVTNMDDLTNNRYEIEKWERFELDGKSFLTCHIIVGNESRLTDLTSTSSDKTEVRQIPVTLLGKRYSGTSQISFTGGMVNATSGYENAETSALGRALAFAGIGLLEGVASADEIHKAKAAAEPPKEPTPFEHELNVLRVALSDAGLTGKTATDFCVQIIGLPRPETLEDIEKLMKALEGGNE